MTEMPSPIVDDHLAWSTEPGPFSKHGKHWLYTLAILGVKGGGPGGPCAAFSGTQFLKESRSEVEKRKQTEKP